MSETVAQMRADLAALSEPERAELALFLIESLETGADADAEEAWRKELSLRVAEVEDRTATGEPAEKVLSELRAKYS